MVRLSANPTQWTASLSSTQAGTSATGNLKLSSIGMRFKLWTTVMCARIPLTTTMFKMARVRLVSPDLDTEESTEAARGMEKG